MEKKEIKQKVYEIIINTLGVEPEDVKDESQIAGDLGGDSLDEVEITMKLESEFSIAISDDKADKCKTVGDICKLVEGILNEE